MGKYMFLTSPHPKIFFAFLFILLLLFFSNSCLAATYEYKYELLDSPDGSTIYQLTVSVTEALYENYSSRNHNLYNYDFSRFVTPDALKPIADDLWKIYSNKEDFANGVLMLVHQIPYIESDPQKYPVETIVENEGDCDLFSLMAASIMKAGGFDVILLTIDGQDHMLLGINLPEDPKDARSAACFYSYDGKKYYVAETTGANWERGWRVGEFPEILQSAVANIMPIDNFEREAPGQVSSRYSIPDSSALYLSLSTHFAFEQKDIEISGLLSPSLEGETIMLYVSSLNSPSTLLATVVTDSNGEYSHIWHSPPGGINSVIARWSGDEDYNGADSSTFRLVVISFELLIIGIILISLLVILLVVVVTTRGNARRKPENNEDWKFA